jgi:hypothetical protein
MDPIKATFEKQAEQIIKNLKKRNITGVYCENKKEAVEAICRMIPENSLVGLGGSVTIIESGLVDALRKMDIRLLDRYKEGVTPERVAEMRREGLLSDIYIASSNAMTSDGKLVNQDGVGNRVAAMIYGPKKVILMVGMNKVVKSVDEAIARIKTTAAPINAVRVQVDTPCSKLGFCNDPHCHPPNRICNHLVITEACGDAQRITVVLIGEALGY